MEFADKTNWTTSLSTDYISNIIDVSSGGAKDVVGGKKVQLPPMTGSAKPDKIDQLTGENTKNVERNLDKPKAGKLTGADQSASPKKSRFSGLKKGLGKAGDGLKRAKRAVTPKYDAEKSEKRKQRVDSAKQNVSSAKKTVSDKAGRAKKTVSDTAGKAKKAVTPTKLLKKMDERKERKAADKQIRLQNLEKVKTDLAEVNRELEGMPKTHTKYNDLVAKKKRLTKKKNKFMTMAERIKEKIPEKKGQQLTKQGDPKISLFSKEALALALLPVGLLYMVVMLFSLNSNKLNWEVKIGDDEAEKTRRSSKRGEFISLLLSLSTFIQMGLSALGAEEQSLLTNYGFIFAAVMGFLGDKMIGTDDGYAYRRHGGFNYGIQYAMGSLATPGFFRYIITVLLDMFISSPIQSVFSYLSQDISKNLMGDPNAPLPSGAMKYWTKYRKLIGQEFSNIVQSVVAVITFKAYTNETRFRWAYPSSTAWYEDKISPAVLQLATTVAGVVYLIATMPNDVKNGAQLGDRMNRMGDKGMDFLPGTPMFGSLGTKTIYVVAAIVILVGLSSIGEISAPQKYTITKEARELTDDEGNVKKDEKGNVQYEVIHHVTDNSSSIDDLHKVAGKWWLGCILFGIMCFIGFFLPLKKNNPVIGAIIAIACTALAFVIAGSAAAKDKSNHINKEMGLTT